MTVEPVESLGDRVRRLRRDRGWSQEQLCKRAGISKSFISEVENSAATPGGPVLIKLASSLGASLDYLLTGREPEPVKSKAVEIPQSLAAFADKRGLPFRHVVVLNEVLSSIEGRRRDAGAKDLSEADWAKLYESVRRHLPEE